MIQTSYIDNMYPLTDEDWYRKLEEPGAVTLDDTISDEVLEECSASYIDDMYSKTEIDWYYVLEKPCVVTPADSMSDEELEEYCVKQAGEVRTYKLSEEELEKLKLDLGKKKSQVNKKRAASLRWGNARKNKHSKNS